MFTVRRRIPESYDARGPRDESRRRDKLKTLRVTSDVTADGTEIHTPGGDVKCEEAKEIDRRDKVRGAGVGSRIRSAHVRFKVHVELSTLSRAEYKTKLLRFSR